MARSPEDYNDYSFTREHALDLIAQIKQWLGSSWKHHLFTNVPKSVNSWHFYVYRRGIRIDCAFNHKTNKIIGYQAQLGLHEEDHGGCTLWMDRRPAKYHKNPLLAFKAAVKRMDDVMSTLNSRADDIRVVLEFAKKRLTK